MKLRMQPPPPRQRLVRSGRSPTGRRSLAVATALVVALLMGLDIMAWLRLEHALDRSLGHLAEAAHAAGWTLDATKGGRGGWPMTATLTLLRPSLRGGGGLMPGGIAWSGDSVTLSLSLLHPDRAMMATAGGTQTVMLALNSPLARTVRFWGGRITLRLPIPTGQTGNGSDRGLRFHADALQVAPAGVGPDNIARLAGVTARLRWPDADAGGPGPDCGSSVLLSLFARDLALPARFGVDGVSGTRVVERARLDAALAGDWKQGIRMRINRAGLEWNGSRVDLGGAVSLRPDGVMDGNLTLDAVDADQGLHRLEDAGLVGAGTGRAARAVLGLVAAAEPGPVLRLPLALRDGTLRMGEIPLLRLPRLFVPFKDGRPGG